MTTYIHRHTYRHSIFCRVELLIDANDHIMLQIVSNRIQLCLSVFYHGHPLLNHTTVTIRLLYIVLHPTFGHPTSGHPTSGHPTSGHPTSDFY